MVTTVELQEDTRDELRMYKAKHGLTYNEAVEKLLADTGWYDD